ncbi:hypothetical protein HNQ77_004865 [Silvibacterium bohemicum]|uniref:Uncharacterized protein n=2 Tax=Silvibacterium bohemicum TaxID=1577686 RepID=A0A841K9B7_9BACT|nr:hypothetical protein [Silvibacterium bohemicum]
MKNFISAISTQLQDEEDNPLTRAAFAVGVGLLIVASVLPHSERWTMCGIGLIVVSSLY